MNKVLLLASFLSLTTTAFAKVSISSVVGGSYSSYELTLTGNDSDVLSSVLDDRYHSVNLPQGIELLSCSDKMLCTIKLAADVYMSHYNIRNAEFFKENADSVLNNQTNGITLTSPTSAYYFWEDVRKSHARNDESLYKLLKNSRSELVNVENSNLGTRLTVKSDNLNLSCLKLNDPIKFNYYLIGFGHLGGIGEVTKNIYYVCQLNVKIEE